MIVQDRCKAHEQSIMIPLANPSNLPPCHSRDDWNPAFKARLTFRQAEAMLGLTYSVREMMR